MDRQDTLDFLVYLLFIASVIVLGQYFSDWLVHILITWVVLVILPLLLPDSSGLRYYACFVSYTLVATFISLISTPFFLLRPCNPDNIWLLRHAEYFLSKLLGLSYEVKGIENLSKTKKAIVLVNHQSIIDVFVLSKIWPEIGKGRIIAKSQLFYYWPIGLAAWLSGCIMIQKNMTPAAREEFTRTVSYYLQNDVGKSSIVIFPEGRRGEGGRRHLQPFRKGAFWLSLQLDVPLVPVVISPFQFLRPHSQFSRGKITIEVLEPVSLSNVQPEDIDSAVASVHQSMDDVFKSHWAESTSELDS